MATDGNPSSLLDALCDLIASKVSVRLADSGHQTPNTRKRLLTVEQAAEYLGRTKEAVQTFDRRREAAHRESRPAGFSRHKGFRPMDRTKQAAVDAKPERILPMECPECGCTWFAEETVNPVRTGWNGELSQIGLMPLAELICLCGAPQRPPLGGTRSGRIANYSISGLMDSVAKAREEVKRRHEIAPIDDAAYKSLAKKGRLQGLQRDRNLVARRLGELLRRPGQKGANWRPPQREPASQGRDWLALELQARGCTFDEARSLVEAIFASIEAALKRGETVETPLGTFRVEVTEPFLRRRSGHFEWIRRGRKRRVAFKGVAIGPGAPEGGSV